MDFERLGAAIGYARTLKNYEAAFNREIATASAEIQRLTDIIHSDRRFFRGQIAKLEHELRAARGEPETVADREADARAARDAVLAEPVRITRWWGLRRVHWRRDEYRSVTGAERARARAAQAAYDGMQAD